MIRSQGSQTLVTEFLKQYASPFTTQNFLAKSRPHLFPYGHGDITGDESKLLKVSIENVAKYYINLGMDRAFQRDATYYFSMFRFLQRKKVSSIAWLASDRSTARTIATDAGINSRDGLKAKSILNMDYYLIFFFFL